MSRTIKKIIILTIFMLLKLSPDVCAEEISNTKFFDKIAVSKVQHQNGKFVENNLVIRPYTMKHEPSDSGLMETLVPSHPKFSEPIWTITPQQLPVTEDTCIVADADLCTEEKDDYWRGECVHSCIYGGANLLAYDKKAGKLYLSADSTALGTGGGPFFLFVADINKKEVEFLKIEYGPFDGDLSPDGKNLLLYGGNYIVIYDTSTGKEFDISEENNWHPPHERLHYLGDIHWLSDTQFSYQDGVRHSKFQGSFDEMKENIYDIPSRTIIRTRTMAKSEYDSTPYVETN